MNYWRAKLYLYFENQFNIAAGLTATNAPIYFRDLFPRAGGTVRFMHNKTNIIVAGGRFFKLHARPSELPPLEQLLALACIAAILELIHLAFLLLYALP